MHHHRRANKTISIFHLQILFFARFRLVEKEWNGLFLRLLARFLKCTCDKFVEKRYKFRIIFLRYTYNMYITYFKVTCVLGLILITIVAVRPGMALKYGQLCLLKNRIGPIWVWLSLICCSSESNLKMIYCWFKCS